MPARNARHGHLFTWSGVINIKNAEVSSATSSPIDPQCDCPVCRRYSRAYLRHLFKAEEMLAMRFAVMHNLYFYNHAHAAHPHGDRGRGVRGIPEKLHIRTRYAHLMLAFA